MSYPFSGCSCWSGKNESTHACGSTFKAWPCKCLLCRMLEGELGGAVFVCSAGTVQSCLAQSLLGMMQDTYIPIVQHISVGLPVSLTLHCNYDVHFFEATSGRLLSHVVAREKQAGGESMSLGPGVPVQPL